MDLELAKKKLHSEVKTLLRFYAALIRILKKTHDTLFNKIDRTTYADLLILLKAAENDIIIRLAKLDDKTKNTISFQKILLLLPKDHKNIMALKKTMMDFSSGFETLKKQRRDQELAHLNKNRVDNELHIHIDLRLHINNALNVMDVLFDDDVKYHTSDGAYEKYELKDVFKNTLGTLEYPANNFVQ